LVHGGETAFNRVGLNRGFVVRDVVRLVVAATGSRHSQVVVQLPQPIALI
jgi:hypothetical protein